MTQDPACASVRPRDAIFAFVLAAVLEHVLHELLHTFAIPGVHDLEQSVKLHWLRIREAEQLSPFLRYPKFVARMFQSHRPRFAALAARLVRASLSRSASSARPRSAMPAESAIAVMVTTAVQYCRARSDWFSVFSANGPKPCRMPHIAIAERMKMPVAVSRCVKRNAVQMTIAPQLNAIG